MSAGGSHKPVSPRGGQVIGALVVACAAVIPNASAGAECEHLPGTFIQLTNAQAAWSTADWRVLFNQFQTLGIKNLFVQWSVLNDTAFFPTAQFKMARKPLLPIVLDHASPLGLGAWIGMHLDARYWQEIAQSADRVSAYFAERTQGMVRFLGDLNAAVESPAFAGWYITDEIDDQTWHDRDKRAVLKQYLSTTVALLKGRRPGSKVAISGFSNSTSDPAAVAEFWTDIIKATSIDILLFQDGVGEGKLALANLGGYDAALAEALSGTGARFAAVVELFSLMPNGKRVPGPIDRIREQMAVADRFSDFPPVAFSVPDYMNNLAGVQAANLFSDFVSAPNNCQR
jgi:hypothetical protein